MPTEQIFPSEFGALVCKMREEAGLTREQLARALSRPEDRSNWRPEDIGEMECGMARPTRETVCRIALICGWVVPLEGVLSSQHMRMINR